jgi:N-acyl-D-amino-acid deacylase
MFDLLIKGATIVDGTGAKTWVGDTAITGDRFVALDRCIPGEARQVLAGDGYVLAPGFIDIHCHSDFSLFDHPGADIKLRQGVTLEVLGNCGTSLAPLDAISRTLIAAESDSDIQSWEHPLDWTSYGQYARALETSGLAINVTGMVGHGTLRLTAMGPSDKTPTSDQMARMKSLSQGRILCLPYPQRSRSDHHSSRGSYPHRPGSPDSGSCFPPEDRR